MRPNVIHHVVLNEKQGGPLIRAGEVVMACGMRVPYRLSPETRARWTHRRSAVTCRRCRPDLVDRAVDVDGA